MDYTVSSSPSTQFFQVAHALRQLEKHGIHPADLAGALKNPKRRDALIKLLKPLTLDEIVLDEKPSRDAIARLLDGVYGPLPQDAYHAELLERDLLIATWRDDPSELRDFLNELQVGQQDVVLLLTGLCSSSGRSPKSVAQQLGRSVENVQFLSSMAFQKLSHASNPPLKYPGMPHVHGVPDRIETLDLPARVSGRLKGAGINTLTQLFQCEEKQLMAIPSFGKTALLAVIEALDRFDFQLRTED